MKRTLFFTSLTVATGITIIELLMFFFYFTWDTQRNLTINADRLAQNTYDVINKHFDFRSEESKQVITRLKLYLDDVHTDSAENDRRANRTLYIKAIVLTVLLVIAVLLSYATLQNKSSIRGEVFGIVVGVVAGAVTQFLFIKTFVYNYKTKSEALLLKYVLERIDDIIKVC